MTGPVTIARNADRYVALFLASDREGKQVQRYSLTSIKNAVKRSGVKGVEVRLVNGKVYLIKTPKFR